MSVWKRGRGRVYICVRARSINIQVYIYTTEYTPNLYYTLYNYLLKYKISYSYSDFKLLTINNCKLLFIYRIFQTLRVTNSPKFRHSDIQAQYIKQIIHLKINEKSMHTYD